MLLLFVVLILLAQAMGIVCAVAADDLGWNWRNDEDANPSFKWLGLASLSILLLGISSQSLGFILFYLIGPAVWVLIVSLVQVRQYRISLRTAIHGVAIHFLCFCILFVGLSFVVAILMLAGDSGGGLIFLAWTITAMVSYILFSLFRPTLLGVWRQIRRN